MSKKAVPPKGTTTEDDLPTTAVRERTSVQNIRLMNQHNALAAYADDDDAPEPATAQQVNWEKRYGDLRSYSQKQIGEKERELNELRAQNQQLQAAVNQPMPKTKEELEAWKAQYPDIANIMEALIDERANVKVQQLKGELENVSERLATAEEQRAFAQLKALVPDLEEVLKTAEWQAWFAEFPDAVQEQINKSTDPMEVAKMINKFKATQARPNEPERPRTDKMSVLDAAVRNTGVAPANRQLNYKFTAMQIKAMSPQEFAKNEDAIDDAKRQGLILDDTQRKVYLTDYR